MPFSFLVTKTLSCIFLSKSSTAFIFNPMLRQLFLCFMVLLPLFLANEPSVTFELPDTELHGIDVSHYQRRINWDTLSGNPDVDFAFAKATEGADYVDSLFARNWEEMRRNGIKRGAYHFFRAYGCGYEQAIHFLQNVDLQPGDIAPVLDIELTNGIPRELFVEEIRIWLQTVERCLHVKPIIYTNQNFYENYLAGSFENNPLWIARYSSESPMLTTGKRWDFWQYSHKGYLTGIKGNVDMNFFNGSRRSLEQLCLRTPEQLAADQEVLNTRP
jgi:lysozyme